MSAVHTIAKRAFSKIFTNVFLELKQTNPDLKIEDVQVGIFYQEGQAKYGIFNGINLVKEITLDDYCGGIMDFSGGTIAIDATICQAGPIYAKQLNCKTDDITLVMSYNNKDNYQCNEFKAQKKAAGLFGKVNPCTCNVCQAAGFPFGELYNGTIKAQDFIVKQLIN